MSVRRLIPFCVLLIIAGCDDERFALTPPAKATASSASSASARPTRIEWPPDKPSVGQACRFDSDCISGLACNRRRCVYSGPCFSHETRFEGEKEWGENIRYEYDSTKRQVLAESRRFVDGRDVVTRSSRTKRSALDTKVLLRPNGDSETVVNTNTRFDRYGKPLRVTTQMRGRKGGEVQVYMWEEKDTCELPARIERRYLTDGATFGRVEVSCDEAGRISMRKTFEGLGDAARLTEVQTWKVIESNGDREKKIEIGIERHGGADDKPRTAITLELDEVGNPIRLQESVGEQVTRVRTMDYGCWDVANRAVVGSAPTGLSGASPGELVRAFAGSHEKDGLTIELDVENRRVKAKSEVLELDEEFRVVAQSSSLAHLLLPRARLIQLKRVQDGDMELEVYNSVGERVASTTFASGDKPD